MNPDTSMVTHSDGLSSKIIEILDANEEYGKVETGEPSSPTSSLLDVLSLLSLSSCHDINRAECKLKVVMDREDLGGHHFTIFRCGWRYRAFNFTPINHSKTLSLPFSHQLRIGFPAIAASVGSAPKPQKNRTCGRDTRLSVEFRRCWLRN